MNYIYDIVLNFQDKYYDFFEWKRTDKLRNIMKIPLYKITDKDIINLKYNKIKIEKELINEIKSDSKKNKKIICIVSNGKIALGLLFDDEGNLLKRSSLIFEEEEEANEIAHSLPITKIKYLENTKINNLKKSRLETEKKDKLINIIKETKNISALKYIYYEYYERETQNITKIKKTLISELSKEWDTKQNNLCKLIKNLIKIK